MFLVSIGRPYPLGAQVKENGVNISFVCEADEGVGINLYIKGDGSKYKFISLNSTYRRGNIYSAFIETLDWTKYEYTLFDGKKEYCDPYGKLITGNERWGVRPGILKSAFVKDAIIDNNDDALIKRDYSDSLIYLLHVRGFSKHQSSMVATPGTFEGIISKIPYLKELGITAIELMPAYEFIELEYTASYNNLPNDALALNEPKLNYWGYKDAFYFAPKAAYAMKGMKASDSFLNMVSALHNASIELIMQFYFTKETKAAFILEVLKYWVLQYGIDGFHLLGENIPLNILASEPLFSDRKIMYYGFNSTEIYGSKKPSYKNLAEYNDEYMYCIRRLLKSDEGQVNAAIRGMTAIDDRLANVHYITNSNGFTLMDLVSYDRKHNEINGENNRDGNPYNASWNCGKEGTTTKKSILKLRRKQIKNSIVFNILSQSTPLILAGDEFLNSQKGNNNPYCIDGPLTWLNWNDIEKNKDIFEFYKAMIEFRFENPIIHSNTCFKMNDYLSTGIPDLSFHGEEAWKSEADDLTRHFALLYNKAYEKNADNNKLAKDDLIYIAVNMHWVEHEFALPTIDNAKNWTVVVDTSKENSFTNSILEDRKKILVNERSIIVLKTK